MNADIIYKVFEIAMEKNLDTSMATEVLYSNGTITDFEAKKKVAAFIGIHFDPLRRAYGTGNKKLFADIVAACVKSNAEEADLLLRAHATGNEKLIAEYEAKYGGVDHV